jgi:hypothetical protein
MGADIHMFIEYRCGNGMPWQADDHHKQEWEDRCRDQPNMDPVSYCDSCKKQSKYRCDRGSVSYSQVRATGRNYELFAALASVRGKGREPLGLPDDVSDIIREASEAYGIDGHSHSYMGIEEFKKVIFEECSNQWPKTKKSNAFYGYHLPYEKHPPDYTTLINYCEKLKIDKSMDRKLLGPEFSSEVQVRLVFWFDN